MKKLFSTLFVVLFATSMMAQTGLTCEDPIPVDKSYAGHVDVDPEEGYAELWYSAWTYDLPMHVYFSPDSTNQVEWGPDVEIDLFSIPSPFLPFSSAIVSGFELGCT